MKLLGVLGCAALSCLHAAGCGDKARGGALSGASSQSSPQARASEASSAVSSASAVRSGPALTCERMDALGTMEGLYKKGSHAEKAAKCIEDMTDLRTGSAQAYECFDAKCASLTDGKAFLDCYLQCTRGDANLSTYLEQKTAERETAQASTLLDWTKRADKPFTVEMESLGPDTPTEASITLKDGFTHDKLSTLEPMYWQDDNVEKGTFFPTVTLSPVVHDLDETVELCNCDVQKKEKTASGFVIAGTDKNGFTVETVTVSGGKKLACEARLLYRGPVLEHAAEVLPALERLCASAKIIK